MCEKLTYENKRVRKHMKKGHTTCEKYVKHSMYLKYIRIMWLFTFDFSVRDSTLWVVAVYWKVSDKEYVQTLHSLTPTFKNSTHGWD